MQIEPELTNRIILKGEKFALLIKKDLSGGGIDIRFAEALKVLKHKEIMFIKIITKDDAKTLLNEISEEMISKLYGGTDKETKQWFMDNYEADSPTDIISDIEHLEKEQAQQLIKQLLKMPSAKKADTQFRLDVIKKVREAFGIEAD